MRIVVVGASLAGLRAAESLRIGGFEGEIVMIGDEIHLPYDRPPLSKEALLEPLDLPGDILLRNAKELAELHVDLRLGRRASSLDMHARHVVLDDGELVPFDELIVATGSRARRLPAFEGIRGVHLLRTVEDAMSLRSAMDSASHVIIVGGGFVGAEVACAVSRRELACTVLEAGEAPMSRVLGPQTGLRLARLLLEAGVSLRCGANVVGPVGSDELSGVRLDDEQVIEGDLVVLGVGSVPNIEWLDGSGIDTTNGVLCEPNGRAVGVEGVHAVGDVARWWSPRFGDAVRTEHWTAASDHAQAVTASLLRQSPPPEAVPYVWSDQFGCRVQIAGRCRADQATVVVRDDESGFLAVTGSDERPLAVIAIDDSRGFGRGRRHILRDSSWSTTLEDLGR